MEKIDAALLMLWLITCMFGVNPDIMTGKTSLLEPVQFLK
jgi:hypothetical protein